MKSRKTFLLFTVLIINVIIIPYSGGPGDTISEATNAKLGDNPGTLESYNDVYWFNFSADISHKYNFTLDIDTDNYFPLYIYDAEKNLIEKNTTGFNDRELILDGYNQYLIGVFSSEFSTTPAEFVLIITDMSDNNQEDEGNFFSNLPVSYLAVIISIIIIPTFRKRNR